LRFGGGHLYQPEIFFAGEFGAGCLIKAGRGHRFYTRSDTESIVHEARDDHPEAASVTGEYGTTVTLPDRTLRWEAQVTFRSDADTFFLTYTRRLLRDGVLVRERTWTDAIPRDFQ